MEKKIEWKLSNGKQVTVTVALVLKRTTYADGDKITVDVCEIDIAADVEGMGCVGIGKPEMIAAQTVNGSVLVARIGKIGIVADKLNEINAAIADVEATPEWQAKVARIARNTADRAKYDKAQARMARQNAGTY